jgi:hypothetical protein
VSQDNSVTGEGEIIKQALKADMFHHGMSKATMSLIINQTVGE